MTEKPPLYVDLDGTLVLADVSIESMIRCWLQHPTTLLSLPAWLMRGRSYCKRQAAQRSNIDPATLPYNAPLLAALKEERGKRRIILATASDTLLAESVANHLGIFDDVLGSDGRINLKGLKKAEVILHHAQSQPFAYAGNSNADLPIFRKATEQWVVNARRVVQQSVLARSPAARVIGQRARVLPTLMQCMRPHHWSKNALVFIPLLTAHALTDSTSLIAASIAFVAFSLVASAVYVINDLVDIPADRHHRTKKYRPLAAGTLDISIALMAAILLIVGGATLAALLPTAFQWTIGGYFCLTLMYSCALKRIPIVDVVVLGVLYTLRVIGGTTATGLPHSQWLVAFSMFFFLGLALLKRYEELLTLPQHAQSAHGRGYRASDVAIIVPIGIIGGNLSVLILAIYITSDHVRSLYMIPTALWLICPLLLILISRLWLLASRRELTADPVTFVLRDTVSLSLILLSVAILFVAS